MAIEFNISQNDYDKVNEFSPLTAGEYKVVIESCIVTRTKTSGKDMLKITMKVIAGNCINRKIFDYIVDNEYLKEPCGHVSHHLLHTHYFDRSGEVE